MKKGLFITLEGTEGGGKSTQARLLCEFLKEKGFETVRSREPGGTGVAEAVRHILLHPSSRIAPMTELFLYEAARAQHVAETIRPALERGCAVVCERYTDSTEAYQGYGRGLPLPQIRELNRIATGGLRPDLTILLDVPVEKGLSKARTLGKKIVDRGRRHAGGDRLEREPLDFHKRVRQGFLAIARREPRRVRRVRWEAGADRVHARVVRVVEDFL
ncbi:MAG: dTMP kinase [Elusimicrobia bacterium]|nr:dTMP kinase [Elusimicrobiota bacterium]